MTSLVFSKPVLAGFVLILLSSTVLIAAQQRSSSFGEVVVPQPAKPANALNCVEPTEVMRRDHMKFLLHQRDETVIEGIRSNKYSLTDCIDCHAQAAANEEIVRADNPEFFCTSCHLYTSVKIDCFECHADRPVSSFTSNNGSTSSDSVLAGFNPETTAVHKTSGIHDRLLQQVTFGVE